MPRNGGVSLPEMLLALGLLGVVAAVAVPPAARTLERVSLHRSAALARGHLERARLTAASRREPVRVRLSADRELLLLDSRDSLVAATPLQGEGLLRLDSARLRPATLRYNPRGQAAPGSLYLYRGKRGVRLVSNFLGRVRKESFSLP